MKNVRSIDELIELVRKGGAVKTGINVYNDRDLLLLEKDVLVNNVGTLITLKERGVTELPIDTDHAGGIWDENGHLVSGGEAKASMVPDSAVGSDIMAKVEKIQKLKEEVRVIQERAQLSIKMVMNQVRESGGEFDIGVITDTINDIFVFLDKNSQAFTYMAKDIFSFDNYLYNHSVNVCTIASAVLSQLNKEFSSFVNSQLSVKYTKNTQGADNGKSTSFIYYLPEDMKNIAMGYFLHDMGKVLLPEKILNKPGRLTPEEYELIKKHTYDYGEQILKKNGIESPFIRNVAVYHHSPLYYGEERTYPANKLPIEIPIYVKVCKLVDIYDAMTSKRSYKEAVNPVTVVTNIFRQYAGKDTLLQAILHSFVSTVGIYPPGSVVTLQNGSRAFVLDSTGPICVLFTDENGKTLQKPTEPVNIRDAKDQDKGMDVDRRIAPISPVEAYHSLPEYLKEAL